MAEKKDRTDGTRDRACHFSCVEYISVDEEPPARLPKLAEVRAAAAERAVAAERTVAIERAIQKASQRASQRAAQRAAESSAAATRAARRAAERASAAEYVATAERLVQIAAEIAASKIERAEAAESAARGVIDPAVHREARRAAASASVAEIVLESRLETAIYKAAAADRTIQSANESAAAEERPRRGAIVGILAAMEERPRRDARAGFLAAIEGRARRDVRADFLEAERINAATEAAAISRLSEAVESSASAVTRQTSAIERIFAAATASAVARLEAGAPASEVSAAASAATFREVARLAAGYLDEAENLAEPLAATGGPLTENFLGVIKGSVEVAVGFLEDLATDQECTVSDLESGRLTIAQVSAPRTASEIPQRIETERGASEGSSRLIQAKRMALERKRAIEGILSGSQAKRMKSVIPPKESGTVAESSVTEDSRATLSPREAAGSSATKDSSPERLPKKSHPDKPPRYKDYLHKDYSPDDDSSSNDDWTWRITC